MNIIAPPTYYHQVNLASGFSNANGATVDLFSKNGKDIVSVPNNYAGSQDAAIGDSYFGVITYYADNSLSIRKAVSLSLSDLDEETSVNYGEYIQITLPSNSSAGREYEVSFKISLADNSNYASGGWGVYFSDKLLSEPKNGRLTVTPQVTFSEVVKDKSTWTEVKAKFKATSSEKTSSLPEFD